MKSIASEVWKPLQCDGQMLSQYFVSNYGRVKATSICRVISGKYCQIKKDRIVKPSDNGNGYKYFSAMVDGKRKHFYIHRVVAEMFLDKPQPGMVINHKDYNRGNNRADNLEWCSQIENIQYSVCNMRRPKMMHYGKPSKHIKKRNGRYEVTICHKYIGRYSTEEEAMKVRDKYIAEHYNIRP